MLLVTGQTYFDDADEARAVWLEQAARAVAQQTVSPGLATAEERVSWLAVFDVAEDGTTTLVQGWHRDAFGIVRDGLPEADSEPNAPAPAPEWVQPQGAHDAYPLGAQVTYQGQTWESTAANNVWPPGVFGWVLV